jgi:hypothetical protein
MSSSVSPTPEMGATQPNSRSNPKWGTRFVLGLLLLFNCPPALFYLANALPYPWFHAKFGRGPASGTSKIRVGMKSDEVVATSGQPHKKEVYDDGSAKWIYYEDCWAFNYTGITFDNQGRVTHMWIP